MPLLSAPPKTVSQLIGSQVPDFVRDDYPQFIAFLTAYYEWLESNGAQVFDGKILDSSLTTVVLPATASGSVNAYQDMMLVVLNGPAKGHTRKISSYDPNTTTVIIESAWTSGFVPAANTHVAIRDTMYPDKLLSYRDVDTTLDQFIKKFRTEFLYQIPGSLLADERNVLKHIKELYQARGTEDSFRFLFRIMFGEEIELYYPKVDLFRLSDAQWYAETIIKVTTTGDTFDFINRSLIGTVSGASARVESGTQSMVAGRTVTTLVLSDIRGVFITDPVTEEPELVKIVYPLMPPPQSDLGSVADLLEPEVITKWEAPYYVLTGLTVRTAGDDYLVGDTISISGGGELASAQATVTAVYQTYYNGRAGIPLSSSSTEIRLAAAATGVDDFFLGDEIALTSGTGSGQKRNIVSYDGTTKIAVVDKPFDVLPGADTTYGILHKKGGVKTVQITDCGVGFVDAPDDIAITSADGHDAVFVPALGIVSLSAGYWLPGRDGGIGDAASSTDSFASSNKVIQDSNYWQDFSYDLRTGQGIDKYRDAVKGLLHPAGMKMFGTVLPDGEVDTGLLTLLHNFALYFDPSVLSERWTSTTETVILFDPVDLCVIGATNRSLDAMKFKAFPPNSYFSLQYPFPNDTYWEPGATPNTQLGQFGSTVIGSIVNNPLRRTKINSDSYLEIASASMSSLVGPVVLSLAVIARYRFVGFPPYDGFDGSYPAPNSTYWTGGYANTPIAAFAQLVLSDLIVAPRTVRSNACIDSDTVIIGDVSMPVIGDVCEYDFVEGSDPQTVYNVSPDTEGEFDGVLGSTSAIESNDPVFVSGGLALDSSATQIVNADTVPLSLTQCTVLVIANTLNVSTDSSLVSCIADGTENGFSIDIRANGGISFRVQNAGVASTIVYPDDTITANQYFMAVLRFDHGLLESRVDGSAIRSVSFPDYPVAPTTTSAGWYFGRSSADYTNGVEPSGTFGSVSYGNALFGQLAQTGTTVPIGYFDGILAYAIFYDRPLYDYEIEFAYETLASRLFAERGVVFGPVALTQLDWVQLSMCQD